METVINRFLDHLTPEERSRLSMVVHVLESQGRFSGATVRKVLSGLLARVRTFGNSQTRNIRKTLQRVEGRKSHVHYCRLGLLALVLGGIGGILGLGVLWHVAIALAAEETIKRLLVEAVVEE